MNIVIVGAGLAGVNAAEELRAQGYTGEVTLIGAEAHPPYERPPLSKDVLLGTAEPDSVFVHAPAWYAEQQINLVTGAAVTGIDLAHRRVTLGDRQLPYDDLLVATGAQPRRIPVAERSGPRVAFLRTVDDARALVPRLTGQVLIIGAGWIGLEVAAAARQAGADVTVLERGPRPLGGLLGPDLAAVFSDLHREHGVDLRVNTTVTAIDDDAGRTTVGLSDGHAITADLVLVGIGAEPDDHLAAAAGLATDRGVLVDARLRASDRHVYAAGDVANHDHPLHGRIRVEHWDTAIHQGRHAARSMLGHDEPYSRQPYFFTDQYDLGMEYVGHIGPRGHDEIIVRGDDTKRMLNAVWVRDDLVVAGLHINDWDAIEALRAWVGREATGALRDTTGPLGDIPLGP